MDQPRVDGRAAVLCGVAAWRLSGSAYAHADRYRRIDVRHLWTQLHAISRCPAIPRCQRCGQHFFHRVLRAAHAAVRMAAVSGGTRDSPAGAFEAASCMADAIAPCHLGQYTWLMDDRPGS